jgi:hypothetical protein
MLKKIKFAMTECNDLAPNGYGVAISRWLMGHIARRLDSSLNNYSRINSFFTNFFFKYFESLIIVRFKTLLERDSLMIATAVHPRFKFNWISKENGLTGLTPVLSRAHQSNVCSALDLWCWLSEKIRRAIWNSSDFQIVQKSLTGLALFKSALSRHNWTISFPIYILTRILYDVQHKHNSRCAEWMQQD